MIRILVDSAADFSQAEMQSEKLELVPLQVAMNESCFLDGVDLFPDTFYEMLISADEFPKTSQPSPQDFLEVFEQAKESGDSVLCILLSSALSGTFQSALLAKNMVEYDNIYLIDSLSATAGIRVLVNEAKKMIGEGEEIEKIVDRLEAMKSHVKLLAAVDTLEYLCKGGRLSKTAATIGEMANIKPIITVSTEGKVEVVGKRPGVSRAMMFLNKQLEEYEVDAQYPVYSLFTYGTENCEKLEAKLEKENVPIERRLQIGPTIGTHIGPEAFGICFVEKF